VWRKLSQMHPMQAGVPNRHGISQSYHLLRGPDGQPAPLSNLGPPPARRRSELHWSHN